jgi:hypothetical protein
MNAAMHSAPDDQTHPWLRWLVLGAFFAVFLAVGFVRLIDGDEGYILMAAKLVASGQMPYRDFFFPQGPVMALAYAPVASWHAGRALSALAAAATGTLLVAHLRSRVPTWVVVAAALAYAANSLVLEWFPLVKTYALATAFLYAAHTIASRAGHRWLLAALTGVFCAAAASTRLYLFLAVPLILANLFSTSGAKGRRQLLVATLAMALVGGLLAIPLLAEPASAIYSTITYHLNRPPVMTAEQSAMQKWYIVKRLLLIVPGDRATALQLLLVAAAIAAGKSAGRRSVAVRIALVFVVFSLLLSPTHVQYLCVIVPFVIEAAALGFRPIRGGLQRTAAVAAAAAYVIAALVDLHRFAVTGQQVLGVNGNPQPWKLGSVIEASRQISAVAGDSAVLSSWPGYLVESSARPWPGTENHFAFDAGDGIADANLRRAYHLVSTGDALEVMRDRKVPVVVLGNWAVELNVRLLDRDAVRARGYHDCRADRDLAVFALDPRCSDGAAAR